MSYEYMLGFGAEDDDKFVLGVKVAGSQSGRRSQDGKVRQGSRSQQGGERRQSQYSQEEHRARTLASCGGIECPEGLKGRIFREEENPIGRAEFQQGMESRGCSLLCAVGNSATYCCPSAQTTQEVVTDPFATDPMTLDTIATSIAKRSATQFPEGDVSDGQSGRSPLKLVAILGVLVFGAAGFVGYVVFRRKRTRKSRKKEKS